MEPRFMTPEDLTWKRLVYNFLTKPGMRALFVSTVGVTGGMMWWLIRGRDRRQKVRRKQTISFKPPFSMEWVIDGPKKNSLIEYGCFVEAI